LATKGVEVKTLVLTGGQVEKLLDMKEVIVAVEDAFRYKGQGKVQMPAKVYLDFPKYGGDLRTMPSYVEALDISAVKIVNSHPNNFQEHGMRTVMGTLLLIDPRTGAPLAFMDATHLTGMRTGAASAVASKYLAKPRPRVLGVVGAGNQAKTQILALMTQYGGFEAVRVCDTYPERAWELVRDFGKRYQDRLPCIEAVPSPRECVTGAEIVVTATPSRKPIVMNDWVTKGTHFNCIGADAPGKQELDPMILKRARVVIDDWEQASHSGEINVPLHAGIFSRREVHAEIGEVVAGLRSGRESDEQVTVFCSTGLAIQDCVTAKLVYDAALKGKVGRFMRIVP
jgi:alanine dehydrogenase